MNDSNEVDTPTVSVNEQNTSDERTKIEYCPQCDLPMLHYAAAVDEPERYWCPLDNYEIVDRTNMPLHRAFSGRRESGDPR